MWQRDYWKVLSLCSASFLFYHSNRVMISPLLPLIKADFDLSYVELAAVMVGFEVGYAATIVPGGWLAEKRGRAKTIMVGLLFSSFVLFLTGFASSFRGLLALRVIAGFGFSTYFGPGISLLFSAVPSGSRTTAIGIHSSASSLGRLVAPALAGFIGSYLSWQAAFRVAFIYPALLGLIFAVTLRGKDKPYEHEESPGLIPVLLNRSFIRLCGAYALGLMFFLGLMAFLPLYLSEIYRLDVKSVGILVGLVGGTSILANPPLGFLSDRYGQRKVATVLLLVSSLLNLLLGLHPSLALLIPILVLYGVVLTSPLSIFLAMLARIIPHRGSAIILSIFNGLGLGFSAIANVAFGALADLAGIKVVFYAFVIVTGACLALARKV